MKRQLFPRRPTLIYKRGHVNRMPIHPGDRVNVMGDLVTDGDKVPVAIVGAVTYCDRDVLTLDNGRFTYVQFRWDDIDQVTAVGL